MIKHIAIVGTVRTGSNYLRDLLSNAIAKVDPTYRGPMREFFHYEDFPLLFDSDNWPVEQERRHGFFTRDSAADFMHRRAVYLADSPHRYVFSAHGHHLYGFPEIVAFLPTVCQIVLLDRRDKVAQFQSYVRAAATDQWVIEDGVADVAEDRTAMTGERLGLLHADFCRRVWLTKAVQSALGTHPLVWYEDLCADPEGTVRALTGLPDAEAKARVERLPHEPLDPELLAPFLNADGTLRLDEPERKWFWV